MPFDVPVHVRSLASDEFRQLDYRVMQHAFASQNELGRFCDEAIYRNDLATRLANAGFTAQTEVPLMISCRDYRKTLWVDLLVDGGGVYELKAADALVNEHESQLLTYLFILDARHGKLVNFHPPSVESKFVNAVVSSGEQRRFRIIRDRWKELDQRGSQLAETLGWLCSDWGVYLDIGLFRDALIHFLGGEVAVVRPVPMMRNNITLGLQKFDLLTGTIGFQITAVHTGLASVESGLRHLLALTPLRAIQWINFNRHDVELITLLK